MSNNDTSNPELQLIGTWSRPCVPGASFTPYGPIGPCGATPPRGAYGSPSVTYNGPNIPYGPSPNVSYLRAGGRPTDAASLTYGRPIGAPDGPPNLSYGRAGVAPGACYSDDSAGYGDPGAALSSPPSPNGPIVSTGRNGLSDPMTPNLANSYRSYPAPVQYGSLSMLYGQPSNLYANARPAFQFPRLPYTSPGQSYMRQYLNGNGDSGLSNKSPRAMFNTPTFFNRGPSTQFPITNMPEGAAMPIPYPSAFGPPATYSPQFMEPNRKA